MYAVTKHTLVAVAIVGSVIGVACGDAAADRSGGESGGDSVVLTVAMASDEPPVQLLTYSEHVTEITDGSVTFEFEHAAQRRARGRPAS